MEKHRFGQSKVRYSTDGRILTGEHEVLFPRHNPVLYAHGDIGDYRSYDPRWERHPAERQAYRNPNKPRYDDSSPPLALVQTRPYDQAAYMDYWHPANYNFKPPPIPENNYDQTGYEGPKKYRGNDGALPTKHLYSNDPPLSWTFIVLGCLLLICAIFNLTSCLDRHSYQDFWNGVLVIKFGSWGLSHKGSYKVAWKTYMYTFLGVVSSVTCFVGTLFVLESLLPTTKGLGLLKNVTIYALHNELDTKKSLVAINTDTRVWLCLGLEWITLILLIASMYSLEAGVDALGCLFNVRNKNSRYFNRVDPFCKPPGFNPFMQIPLGQVAAFLGLLSNCTVERTRWLMFWSPVWAGAVVALAGSVSAFGMKRPDKRTLNGVGLFLQVLAIGSALTGIILLAFGLVENIKLINAVSKDYFTDFLVTSCCFIVFTILMLAVSVTFTLGVLNKQASLLLKKHKVKSDVQSQEHSQESDSADSGYSYDYDPRLYSQSKYRDWARY
jgi:hypothetical protein